MEAKPELLSSSCRPVLLLLEAALLVLVLVMEPLLVLLHGVGGVVLLEIECVFFLAW